MQGDKQKPLCTLPPRQQGLAFDRQSDSPCWEELAPKDRQACCLELSKLLLCLIQHSSEEHDDE